MNADKCIHGMTREQRKRDGCAKCDAERHDEFFAAQEEAKIRVRAVGTARELFVGCFVKIQPLDHRTNSDGYIAWALHYAEEFERAAADYIKNGRKDDR